MEYDLVIKNGTVVDPSQGLHERRDIAVAGSRIVAVEPYISDGNALDVIEADGLLVTPGLVDIHVHVWWGVAHLAVEGDTACVARGVTTAVDAGSAGSNTIAGFHRYVIDQTSTRTLAFLHISGMGQLDRDIGELEDMRWARVDRAVDAATAHSDVIVGMKVRLSEAVVGANDIVALERSLEAAEHIGKPLMVHIGGTNHPLEEIFGKMRPGDIVTHSFHGGERGIITDAGRVLPAALEARKRGVIFDVGHGAGSFSFDVAEKAVEHGFAPSTISSDVHRYNIRGPVFDLATTMSKYLYLGLSIDETVSMASDRAARAIGWLGKAGTLRVGAEADISVLRLEDRPVTLTDARGATRQGNRLLVPVETLRTGRRHTPLHSAHPALHTDTR